MVRSFYLIASSDDHLAKVNEYSPSENVSHCSMPHSARDVSMLLVQFTLFLSRIILIVGRVYLKVTTNRPSMRFRHAIRRLNKTS